VKERVDAIVFCNGIHYIQDKERLLSEVATTLKPGGTFAFNTSFFQGAQPPDTEQFYRRWMFKAVRTLRARHGLMPKASKVESRRQLTPDEYAALLQRHGFSILRHTIQPAPVPLQGWVDISRYRDFIRGALPGVPLKQASEALQEAVRQTFQELNLQAVPRNWLTVVAQKA
jgi:ubiquinone/menaquinone biosynthesis C-methylase UbiE